MNFEIQDNWADRPEYKKSGVHWVEVDANAEGIIYEANVASDRWVIRLNDFPDEPLYTLIVAGKEIIHFNEWPTCWHK